MSAEERILIAVIGLTALLGLIFLISKLSKKSNESRNVSVPKSFWILFVLFLYLIFIMQYGQIRPNNEIMVVFNTIFSVVVVLLFGVSFSLFREVKVFIGNKKFTLIRCLFIIFWFNIGYTIVNRGLVFTFNGILSFQSISLSPEFEKLIIPTISGIIIASYRLTKIIPTTVSKIFGKISEDLVLFSLSMFWLSSIATSIKMEIETDFPFQTIGDATTWGMATGLISLVLEGYLLWLLRDATKLRPELTFKKILTTFSSPFKPNNQSTLDQFWIKKKKQKDARGIHRATDILNHKFSIHYRGRTFKASWFIHISFYILGILLIAILIIPQTVSVLVPVYSYDIECVSNTDLPFDVTLITSDEMENLIVGKNYAFPIVKVKHSNETFKAPLNDRFVNLNSSQFEVFETGDFILFSIKKIFAETTVKTSIINKINYNMSDEKSFQHFGFYRDAEIIYSLASNGYENVVSLTKSSMQGLILVAQKTFIATGQNDDSISIYLIRKSETAIIEDSTYLISLDEEIMKQISFLIEQTKINTECIPQKTTPTFIFEVIT